MIKLGQHFLINKEKTKKIIEALDLKDGDFLIEIGPGHGELTNELKIKSAGWRTKLRIIAVEKDEKLATYIQKKFVQDKNIQIIQEDILKILPDLIIKLPDYPAANYKITGNIPYYITGYLLRIIGELKNKPRLTILMIQKEVAERICANPPGMNLLAASVQFWAEPEIIEYVSRKDFKPQPKVDSAIIKLITLRTANHKLQTNYYKTIKILFKHPRKTILNNLRPVSEKLNSIGIDLKKRPQDLSVDDIKKISEMIY